MMYGARQEKPRVFIFSPSDFLARISRVRRMTEDWWRKTGENIGGFFPLRERLPYIVAGYSCGCPVGNADFTHENPQSWSNSRVCARRRNLP